MSIEEFLVDGIDLTSLLKARQKFENFRKNIQSNHVAELDEQLLAGLIQSFGYSYELTWKSMKKILAKKGLIFNNPRDTFRQAAIAGYISDPEVWFAFVDARNLTVHTYDEENAYQVEEQLDDFSVELLKYLKNIGAPLRYF